MAKDLKTIPEAAAKENEPPIADVVEAGFRRGFAHGVHNLTEAVLPHLSVQARAKLHAYNQELRNWRGSKQRGFPPDSPDLS